MNNAKTIARLRADLTLGTNMNIWQESTFYIKMTYIMSSSSQYSTTYDYRELF